MQCTHEGLTPGDETLHLFTHYITRDAYQLWEYMTNWMQQHINFVQHIGSYLFDVKGLDVQQYIDSMANNGQPLDEIGIVVIACMYHVHIGIIMDGCFWTSCRDHDLKECKILLSWQGQLNFVDISGNNRQKCHFIT